MIPEANQHAIEDAGLSFIIGARMPEVPYGVSSWRRGPVKRNRLIKLTGGNKSINREPEAKARGLLGQVVTAVIDRSGQCAGLGLIRDVHTGSRSGWSGRKSSGNGSPCEAPTPTDY
jgi:hypothetical protein